MKYIYPNFFEFNGFIMTLEAVKIIPSVEAVKIIPSVEAIEIIPSILFSPGFSFKTHILLIIVNFTYGLFIIIL